MEQEIKLLQNKPLLEIKLLDNSSVPNSGNNFLNTEANIESDSQTAIDNSEQN